MRAVFTRCSQYCMDYINVEDIQTNFVDIGPVNKIMNMLCVWHDGGRKITPGVTRHFLRIPDYLWLAEDGMKMQVYIASGLSSRGGSFLLTGQGGVVVARLADMPQLYADVKPRGCPGLTPVVPTPCVPQQCGTRI